ncbi:hypothetical protein, conserved [Trypanosoma vivax Y486]|uniref:MMS19 nucleotide excision repair protein n=1 Tax=Trypanosoma vivax (strain Y486) TaxID=1055687 RepID=F9WUQ8_TRYVY|nr:hypothetical protein, conserved [Trypanosoma vivax Y486]|eukprot:CCD21307.1 hypothetical protein, conserved [Trypanosoma vivax Y486]
MTEEWSAALEKAICSGTATESTLTYLRQLPLLEVSRLFGPYLTDEVSVTSAVRILGQAAAGRTHVSSEEATPILQFFSAKLTSMQTVEASVEAMAVTVQELSRHNVHTEKVFTCLHDGFLQNISLQALPTQTRHHGYVILEFMASEPMVQWFTVSFLQKLLASIDEESDPALVLRALNLHYFVALCADSDVFRPLLNDYFVSLSSYFPVTFTQPRDCGITRDDLRKALSRCMRSPLYTDLCITFLLSRLASPSTIVKREAVEVLLDIYCSDSEHPMEMLEPHILPTVTHMRNEVVKATSFSHNAPDQHLKNCLTILRSIFKKECSATPATLLCWMDPITSGVLSSLDSGKAACAAYATMLHHITQASLSCATLLVRHLLPQLTSSIGDASTDKDTLFLVLTALLTGVSDLGTSVETRPELQFRAAMISALEAVFPSIVAVAEEPVPVDGTDHTSLNIRCELVSSLLCLDLRLRPWLPGSAVHSLYIVLVTACLSSSEEVCERVSRHVSRIGLVDGNELHKFLGRSLAELRSPAKNVFSLYKCLVESSAPTAVSIIEFLLKRESDNITMLLQ